MNFEKLKENVNKIIHFRYNTLKKDYLFDIEFSKIRGRTYHGCYLKCNEVVLMHIREGLDSKISRFIISKGYKFSYPYPQNLSRYRVTESILKELE